MKIFFIGFTFLFISYANAGSLTLTWDPPVPDDQINANPSILSFKIFYKTGTASYDYSNPAWTGANPLARIIGLQSGALYCFVSRSHKSDINADSVDSNEICGRVPRLNPPSGFQLIDFEAELNLNSGLIHYIGYYSNPESHENMMMETTQKFSEL